MIDSLKKKSAMIVLTMFCVHIIEAQVLPQINQISTIPAQPTSNDSVLVLVQASFPYSSCPVDIQQHNIVGQTIQASAQHCMGILTAICDHTDTFRLGKLPVGSYQFEMQLSSGSGMPPCTPGIVADDTAFYTIQISPATFMADLKATSFKVYTLDNFVIFEDNQPIQKVELYDVQGRLHKSIVAINTSVSFKKNELRAGVYVYRVATSSSLKSGKIIIK